MLLNKTDAAKVAGVSRRSFYNHIPKKSISLTQDSDGEEKIDLSELKRVYGEERVALNLKKFMDEQGDVQEREPVQDKSVQKSANSNKAEIELEVLKERLNHFDDYKQERVREREQLEERIGQLESTLQKALDNQNKTTLLLEHYTKGDEGNEDWKKSIKALEEKIANQEKEAKEKAEEEAKQKELLLAEKKDLNKANKIYAGLALIALLGVIATTVIQSGIVKISF
ncbi:MAG: hypothetical protein ACRBB3_10300 [Alphaproteobacteria bacterium]|tara:strand:- start:71 stop:751 length:681 start_codon:yes stop_codon:yes gene_type:complete